MESYENLEFENEIYLKLKEIEQETEAEDKRYSPEEVLQILQEAVSS